MIRVLSLLPLPLALLAACDPVAAPDEQAPPSVSAEGDAALPVPVPAANEAAREGGTGQGEADPDLARPDVRPIVYNEYNQRIPPGSGCSFADSAGRLLLVATADFDDDAGAEAAVKLGSRVLVLQGARTGGFDALARGMHFADPRGTPYEKSSGIGVNVVRLPGEGTPGEIETTAWPAEMTVSMEGEGMTKFARGRWECGN